MAQPTSSPDISSLDFNILYDISGAVPAITLTNTSTVIHADQLKWWYVITTPSNTPIHTGSSSSPDVSNVAWTTLAIAPGSWPAIFGQGVCAQIEFSCAAPYLCTLYVMDSEDTIYSLQKAATICRPNGNTDKSCGNFGVADLSIKVDCNNARLICNDSTNMAYQSQLQPYAQANTWTLVYPQDETGNQPANGTASNTPSVFFPLAYSANGFNIYLRDYATYAMGDGVYIKLQYKAQNTFNVYCNVDLCTLQCELKRFYDESKTNCGELEDPTLMKKMTQVNFLYSQALTGILQPLCNIDVPAIIKEMEAIFGFDSCACCGQGVNMSASPGSSGGCCPVSVAVLDKTTNEPPANCPQSYFPVRVYDPTATTIIGIASDADTMIALLNADTAWQVYGFAFNAGNCRVGWVLANQGVTVPDVYTAVNGTSCIGDTQSYSVTMHDICLADFPVTVLDFTPPRNAYVDFGLGAGPVYLGLVSSVPDLVTLLNATSTKPASITFSDGGASLAVVINVFNSSCTAYSGTISITTDAGSSSYLLYGPSHENYTAFPPTTNGAELAFGLRGNQIVGHVSGVSSTKTQWHNIKIDNTLIISEGDTGKVYFYDVSTPLQPVLIRTIQLNQVAPESFGGLPKSKGIDGGSVFSFYSLYFPTDFSNMALNEVYIFEGLTGSAWKINMYNNGVGVGYSLVNAGGSGWSIGNTFTIAGGTTLATARVAAVSGGAVTKFDILSTGAGYSTGTGVVCTAITGGTGLTIDIQTVQAGVDAHFQSQTLKGSCPRIIQASQIWFTLDGSLAADIGYTIPFSSGSIAVIKIGVPFSGAAVTTQNISGLGTADDIWVASYDGADNIWMLGENGVLYKYSISGLASSITLNAMGLLGGFKLRGNAKFSVNTLFVSSLGGLKPLTLNIGAMSIGLSAYPTLTQTIFSSYTDAYDNFKYVHNLLPVGDCLVLATGEGYSVTSPPTPEKGVIAVYKRDGSFLQKVDLGAGQNIYNLVPIPNVVVYTPTTLIP